MLKPREGLIYYISTQGVLINQKTAQAQVIIFILIVRLTL